MTENKSYHDTSNPIVLFDGVCNLCNTSVRFLMAYNRKENLHFASLQSKYAKNLLAKYNLSQTDLSTVVFIENEKISTQSTAIFEISKHLIYPWRAIENFKYLPKSITDWFYKLVAKYRYSWFGRKKECMIPKAEWKHRFHG